MRSSNTISPESAISESIGFVLIFSLVIVGISLVTLYGYPVLLQQQATADQKIMEKNMIVLQNDLKSLTYKTVPYKETSLKVGGGVLSVYNSSLTPQSFYVKTNGGTTTVDYYPVSGQLGELRYESNDQGLVASIENGAVIYRQFGVTGSTMLAEPRWFYDAPTKTAVIYMINISSTEMISRSGVGTVQMELVNTSFTSFTFTEKPFIVGYEPDTDTDRNADYSAAWKNYIVNTLGWDETAAGSNEYDLPADTETLVVKEYDVIIRSL